MTRIFILVVALIVLGVVSVSSALCATNEHGPHAGFVRNLGNISVELLPHDNGPAAVFFINPSWGDYPHGTYLPLMQVESAKHKKTKVKCAPDKYGVSCTLNEVKLADGDKVLITVEDKNKKDLGQVVYTFPFKFQE